jgi:hypothetical protein
VRVVLNTLFVVFICLAASLFFTVLTVSYRPVYSAFLSLVAVSFPRYSHNAKHRIVRSVGLCCLLAKLADVITQRSERGETVLFMFLMRRKHFVVSLFLCCVVRVFVCFLTYLKRNKCRLIISRFTRAQTAATVRKCCGSLKR